MKLYRTRPMIVEAMEITADNHAELDEWWPGLAAHILPSDVGDIVVRSATGEFNFLAPGDFHATYEPIV